MTPGEVAKVLAKCALFDYRFGTPSREVLAAWFEALRDLDGQDALDAVSRYYSSNTDRIMPAHVRRQVAELRAERRRRQPAGARALPGRYEEDYSREVRMDRGAATVQEVINRLTEHMQGRQPELRSAFDELRAITPGLADPVVDGEVIE